MKEPATITIAMMKDKITPTWLAQIQIEWVNTEGKDVLPLGGESDPMIMLHRCFKALEKKISPENGKSITIT